MKTKIFRVGFLVSITLLFSCSSTKKFTTTNPSLTDKEGILIENNSNYSSASVVGLGGKIIEGNAEKMNKEKFKKKKKAISDIDGVEVTTCLNEDGTEGIKAVVQGDILFEFDSSVLNENAIILLNQLVNVVKDMECKITIIGHTDNIGEDQYNDTLSIKRATAVKDCISDDTISHIAVKGEGERKPTADNSTEDGRKKNRRVEIIIEQ